MPLNTRYKVNKCFGCIPLQRGCIILGALGMLGAILELKTHIKWLIDYELSAKQCRAKEEEDEEEPRLNRSYESMRHLNDDMIKDKCPNDSVIHLVRFVVGVSSFTYIIYFGMTVMMIHGVIARKPKLITPWLVWETVQIVIGIFSFLGLVYGLPRFQTVSLVEVIMMIYFIIVVASYQLELQQAEERQGDVTVVAVTQTPNREMMVVIPTTQYKEDPPPPYPGLTSVSNPAYNPCGSGFPVHAAYMPPPPQYQTIDPLRQVPIPQYQGTIPQYPAAAVPQCQENISTQMNQVASTAPSEPALENPSGNSGNDSAAAASAVLPNVPINVNDDGSEVSPLVSRPSLPNN